MLQFETRKSAVVSTAHMAPSDKELLEQYVAVNPTADVVIRPYEYGIELCLATEEHLEQMENIANELDLTQEFLNNVKAIMDSDTGLYSVVFDRDAYLVGGLMTFEW